MSQPDAQQRVLDLLRDLNEYGEHQRIEAKTASELGKSVLETVCALTNEPGLDGGHLLLGVGRASNGDLFDPPTYEVVGVPNPEKVADDLASQCASAFNRPLRPQVTPVRLDGSIVLHVRVHEAPPGEKPVYLKKYGLPSGAYRRVSATDQRCTDDDLQVLYDARRRSPYDADVVPDARWRDLDPDAIEEYRELRREIAPEAEELRSSDEELMVALGCAREVEGELRPTVSGLLLFATSLALRRFFGMMRVDYIRVPGREWVPDPHERYTSVPIRAPLIRAVRRAEAAVWDDLPKAFSLAEGDLQRRDVPPPLPRRALREALVNAVMHRDYRVHGAVQVIRYTNRIEIRNPGYSLKAPERLGEPGSETRNPTLAAVFHDTNLAETKGTGIRAMRRLMKQAELVPPTFESDRKANTFTARLVLHHLLTEEDVAWLNALGEPGLSADEKLVLVFSREVGALDNATYRELTGAETLKASAALRHLCDVGLLEKRGQSTATHYIPTDRVRSAGPSSMPAETSSMAVGGSSMLATEPGMVAAKSRMLPREPRKPAGTRGDGEGGDEASSSADEDERRRELLAVLPDELRSLVAAMRPQADELTMRRMVRRLCEAGPYSAEELGALVGRNPDYLKTRHLRPMLRAGELQYTIPDMPKHPSQAYRVPPDRDVR